VGKKVPMKKPTTAIMTKAVRKRKTRGRKMSEETRGKRKKA